VRQPKDLGRDQSHGGRAVAYLVADTDTGLEHDARAEPLQAVLRLDLVGNGHTILGRE